MSRIERALEKAKRIRHLNEEVTAEETNTAEHVVFPARKIIMSNKTVFAVLIFAIIVASLFVFSVINYFVLKKLIERPEMKIQTSIQKENLSQQVQPPQESSGLPNETVSVNGSGSTRKEPEEKSLPPQKLARAKFTVQVGAFTNVRYAKSLAKRLDKKAYKVYITQSEEKGEKLYKVSIGNFSSRQEADSLSKEINTEENLDTFIAVH